MTQPQRGGWVKLWRSSKRSAELVGDAVTQSVWSYFLMSAAREPRTFWHRGEYEIALAPGQWFGTYGELAKWSGGTYKQVRRAVKKLSVSDSIRSEPRAKRGILITIVNWDTYQGDDDAEGKEKGIERAQRGHREGIERATTQEVEEKKKKKNAHPVEIPKALRTPEFTSTWDEWLKHRRASRWTTSDYYQRKVLKDLGKYPPGLAVAAIEQAMSKGWQGVFPEKLAGRPQQPQRPPSNPDPNLLPEL